MFLSFFRDPIPPPSFTQQLTLKINGRIVLVRRCHSASGQPTPRWKRTGQSRVDERPQARRAVFTTMTGRPLCGRVAKVYQFSLPRLCDFRPKPPKLPVLILCGWHPQQPPATLVRNRALTFTQTLTVKSEKMTGGVHAAGEWVSSPHLHRHISTCRARPKTSDFFKHLDSVDFVGIRHSTSQLLPIPMHLTRPFLFHDSRHGNDWALRCDISLDHVSEGLLRSPGLDPAAGIKATGLTDHRWTPRLIQSPYRLVLCHQVRDYSKDCC